MKLRWNIFIAILLGISLVLTGCGTSEKNNDRDEAAINPDDQNGDEKEATEGNGNQGDLLSQVKKKGELLIGTEGTYPPFTFHDDNGKLTGFDVEISKEIAKRMDVKPVFLETQWDAMFAGLDAKRFDMVANQVGIREDRQQKYDFSDPYITSTAVLITRKDNKKITGFKDIKGLKSAQSLTSNYADIARKYKAEIVGVEGFNQAIELLNSKRVDVTINDNLTFLDYKKNKPDAPVKIVEKSEDASQCGLMFRKKSETLVEEVNNNLQDMIDDGTYEKISMKWFGENVLK